MPSYDLQCQACGARFEVFRQGFLRDLDRACPACETPAARQLMTGFVTSRPWQASKAPRVTGFADSTCAAKHGHGPPGGHRHG